LAEGWLTGSNLVASDGVYPTEAGHQALAQRILTDLTKLGITTPATAATATVTTATTASAGATPTTM
jgi:hypothetical protein